MTGVSLWQTKKGGVFRASWKERGKVVQFNTGERDHGAAIVRAAEEITRRQKPNPSRPNETPSPPPRDLSAGPSSSAADAPTPAPPTTNGHSNGARRPITEALARALGGNNGASPLSTPIPVPLATAPANESDEKKAKARKLYEVFGKAMAYLTEGGLKRAVRWAGREPEDMDDDEQQLVREGWEEKGADWFGKTDIGPWGKIALGSMVAGVGMYMGGKPLPPKKQPPRLEPPADRSAERGDQVA